MLARSAGGDQVEGPGSEPVGGAGQRADRADLDDVAGEVGLEGLVGGHPDLLVGTTLEHVDELVPGDLLGKAGAAGAEHAALPIQQHLGGDRDRFGEGAFGVGEPRVHPTVGHRLVLQRTLATLVADRAVQRVVDQQQLHDALLGLVCHRRGVLGLHDHALGDRQAAAGLRLGHRAPTHLHLDQALPAGGDRVEQRVVAEPRHDDAQPLAGPDHQLALGRVDFATVDGQPDVPFRNDTVSS